MDGQITSAEEKLQDALKAATAAAVELQRQLPEHQGVPHYSVIEQAAHEVGRRLSQMIQNRRSGDVAAETSTRVPCPCCQKSCSVNCKTRAVKSIDGEFELIESLAHCTRCKRDFFPSADSARV